MRLSKGHEQRPWRLSPHCIVIKTRTHSAGLVVSSWLPRSAHAGKIFYLTLHALSRASARAADAVRADVHSGEEIEDEESVPRESGREIAKSSAGTCLVATSSALGKLHEIWSGNSGAVIHDAKNESIRRC